MAYFKIFSVLCTAVTDLTSRENNKAKLHKDQVYGMIP